MEPILRASNMMRSAQSIAALMRGVEPRTALKRPRPDTWCLAEIMAHLHDEEKEDFRVRLDYILNLPGKPWPAIDPEGWVTERKYAERPLEESVMGFLKERQDSAHWLCSLRDVDWESGYDHPSLGLLRAGDILAAWEAHDLLHLRQIAWTLFQLLGADAKPYTTAYAGTWPEVVGR